MGTFSLMCGMSLCARLVERRSTERRFKRRDRPGEAKPRIFWLQCGDQRVGDQQFRSFAYSEEKKQYMTSFIHKPDSLPIFGLPPRFVLWAAIVSSLLGFVCQFVGFRGLHGSIILYQLACTLIMAGVRAGLRSRRLERKKNRLESFHRWSESDELDWQALSIVGDDYPLKNAESVEPLVRHDYFDLMNSHLDTGLKGSPLSKAAQDMLLASSAVEVSLSKGDVGSGVVGFRPSARGGRQNDTRCSKSAAEFIRILEGNPKCVKLDFQPLHVFDPYKVLPDFDLNPAARIVNIRARLGQLSGDECQPSGIPWDPELQAVARRLQNALQNSLGYIFGKAPLQSGWKGTEALVWSAVC
ncbi:unnamed protein product [Clonostachys rosea f. rosea IK726]|uniref:Uncharacterized protein n=1 Tax=Clonostachys rosea f. rosea IK726 TaxID=1349383 RepID=A0ACA9U7Y8_BIOOC|nr:unnamed protein product [Clonostachys rosea f. rosea IK726]